jgi:S1-C subfamily serine protease
MMSSTLVDLSQGLSQAVETAGAYVVRVEARRRLPASGILWSEDGIIVTANHVVRKENGINIGSASGEKYSAELVGRDPSTDLAVLKSDLSGASIPNWATPEEINVGHLVLALGRPGERVQATLGIVSALGENWRTPVGGHIDRYLQTDVVMYPGFSGGPLVDSSGQLVGLNSSALLRGVSVAVPYPTIERSVSALLEHGRIRRGYLGIRTQPVRLPETVAKDVGQETGLMLVSIESDSPADAASLVMGDTIIAIDDQPVRHFDDLLSLLNSAEIVGKEVSLRILRAGEVRSLSLKIGEQA